MKPVPFEDFSGGITDKDVPGETNRYEICDNLLIDGDKRLYQRDGLDVYSSSAYKLGPFDATVTIASPGVWTKTAHGLSNGTTLTIFTTGALPTGLSTGTTYYVVNTSTDTFQLSLTDGGSAINTTGSQSGTHTIHPIQRATRLVNFKNDTEIVAFQNKKAWHQATALTGAWAEVTGPGGGSSTTRAFNTDNAAKIVDTDQWQGHLFAASSDGDPVIKMYRDSGGTMRLRTAGMPEVPDTLYPADGGLADAITLANDIRTQMIAHFGANGATQGVPNSSKTGHHVSHASLTAQASAVSASTAATNLSTLITLLNTLRTQYGSHMDDAQAEGPGTASGATFTGGDAFRNYHMCPEHGVCGSAYAPFMRLQPVGNPESANRAYYAFRHFLNFTLHDPSFTIPSSATIADVLPYLNDLRNKWNWHTKAPMTHYNANVWNGTTQFIGVGSFNATVTIASPGVFTALETGGNSSWSVQEHGLQNTAEVQLTTTGALPTGLSAGVTYYVVNRTATTFQLSLSSGGAAINTSGSQSGTHTVVPLGAHNTAYSAVKTYTWANISPPLGAFAQYVSDLYAEFFAHRVYDMHMEWDSTWITPVGITKSPSSLEDIVTLLGWLCYSITYHVKDAHGRFTTPGTYFRQNIGSVTSGAATLSLDGTAGTLDQFKGMRVVPLTGTGASPYSWAFFSVMSVASPPVPYNVTGSTAATPAVLTCDQNFTATLAAAQFILTGSRYHMSWHEDDEIFDPSDVCSAFNAVDFTFSSASAYAALADIAKNMALYLKTHTISELELASVTGNTAIYSRNGKSYSRYQSDDTVAALGTSIFTHAPMERAASTVDLFLSLNSALLSTNTPATQLAESRFTTAPSAGSFNYKMLFRYDYEVGTKDFTDRGKPSSAINVIGFENDDASEAGGTESGKFYASLSSIYSFSNAANENFYHTDTTNFKKEIYRTIANGQNYYRVDVDAGTDASTASGSLTNATTTLSDYSTDTYLINQLALYTNSGAPANGRPPTGTTSVHVFKNVMYYVVGNRVYQSIPNDLDSVPATFYEEFEEDIVCVSSTKNVAVALGTSKIYRLIGGFDDAGRGALTYDPIFDRTGVISQTAVVKADDAVFFAGKDGFYVTDGFKCFRVTDLEDTFISYTDTAAKRARIQGAYDNISKRIYWTFQTAAGSNPDKIWVLDLQFGIKPDAVPVTTLSKTSGFNPTALSFFGGQLYYGDGDGYVWVQTRGRNIDLVKDTGVAATSWAAEAVRWNFKSCHSHYGEPRIRKYFTSIGVQFEQQSTNVSCQITSDADKGRIESDLPVIRSRKLVDWEGDSNGKLDWIASVYPAKAGNLVDEWRWFKGDGSLRSNFRAIELALAYCVIVKSTDMGTVTVANIAGNVYSVTLTSLSATRKWPLYSVGYFIRINSVDYPVTVRTSDTVVRIDSTGLTSPTQTVHTSWEMWGYPKNERVRLLGYTVNVDAGGDNQTASQGPVVSGGRNA